MPIQGTEIVDVEIYLHHETPKAILVSKDGRRSKNDPIWLAKSMIEYEVKNHNLILVTMPQWLAHEKGLI